MLRKQGEYKKESIKIKGKKLSYTDIYMPKHASKMNPSNPKPKNKPRSLTATEEKLLREVAPKHTKKHMDHMKAFMKAGKGCFADAHKDALKVVGK